MSVEQQGITVHGSEYRAFMRSCNVSGSPVPLRSVPSSESHNGVFTQAEPSEKRPLRRLQSEVNFDLLLSHSIRTRISPAPSCSSFTLLILHLYCYVLHSLCFSLYCSIYDFLFLSTNISVDISYLIQTSPRTPPRLQPSLHHLSRTCRTPWHPLALRRSSESVMCRQKRTPPPSRCHGMLLTVFLLRALALVQY